VEALSDGRDSNSRGKDIVLLVDHDEDSRIIYSAVMAHAGIDVVTVQDGAQGIAAGRRIKPKVIVVDIGLPVLSGYEVLRELRTDANLERTTIIALTSRAMVHEQHELHVAGFDAVFSKPIDPSVLLQAVKRGIEHPRGSSGPSV
jgi:CheY-like chemotaxis protein